MMVPRTAEVWVTEGGRVVERRVYLPVSQRQLSQLVSNEELGPPPLFGFAVTPALREWYAAGDDEELEYVALAAAAREALRVLSRTDGAVNRRTVLAFDTGHASPDASLGKAAVVVERVVRLCDVAAVHADTEQAAADVAAAVEILRSGGPRTGDDEFVVEGCEAHELAWFATQEIRDLL